MQNKSEKGDLGKVLAGMRLALCNESIADMANTLGISPTYLNSIECNIRPCTFKILEAIFINYVELEEIKSLNKEVFSPQNVFNSAWNAGLHSTLGIPLSSSQVFKVLQSRIKKKPSSFEQEKSNWLQKIYNNPEEFNSVPSKYFLDVQFTEDIQQAVRFSLMQNLNSETENLKESDKIDEIFNSISKKTIKAISKCGQHLQEMEELTSKLSPVKILNKQPKTF